MNWNTSVWVIFLFIVGMFLFSQRRFKNKMLCTFHRPNQTKIEKWVPLYARYVIFDQGKYGIGHYDVDSNCIELQWYDRGINKFFPTLIPTLEFWWNTPNPLNPRTRQTTWHTPEVRHAAWQEQSHNAYAKAAAIISGVKQNKVFTVIVPLMILGILVLGGLFMYRYVGQIQKQMFDIQQQLKLR